jgi:lipid-A-disaccharide synthase
LIPILIVAGESSGEAYGADLVREFRKRRPEAQFFGIGGRRMAEQGVETIFSVKDLSLMGVFEVLAHIPRVRGILRRLDREAAARGAVAAVLIDSPDFNLRLAGKLRKRGIPVLYYVSPTVWAWRPGRLKTIRRSVTRMMLIFPFEERIYRTEGIPAAFVGHPLLERIGTGADRAEFVSKYGLDPDRKIVAVLPGSRRSELGYHAPVVAEAMARIRRLVPVQFVLVQAENIGRDELEKAFPGGLAGITVVDRDPYDAMAAADLVMAACGTATLEAALLGTPVVAFYRISPFTYLAGRPFVRIGQYCIVNILAGKAVVPELIQKEFTPENLTREAMRIISSAEAREAMKAEFRAIRRDLGERPASVNVALELDRLIDPSRPLPR